MAGTGGDAPDMVETFSALQALLLSADSIEGFLDELASLSARLIDPPASVGITLSRDGRPFTVVYSDDRAPQVDETQYVEGDGPCLETLRTGRVVQVKDQRLETRWGAYAHRAAEQGVCSSLSLPLMAGGATVGALNIYSFDRADAYNEEQRSRAELFAAQASTALTLVMRETERQETSTQLEQALSSRTVIDQAIGVIMGQQRCSADEAFNLMRRHSQNTNRKLRDVASDMITRVTGQPPATPRGFQRVDTERPTPDSRA